MSYDKVRDALERDAIGIFQRATHAASARADELVANLRLVAGAIEIGAEVAIEVRVIAEKSSALGDRKTVLEIEWHAAKAASLFPAMEATLTVHPLSAHETQIDLHGRYRPPLGVLGSAFDAVAGHRIAEATVLRFVQDVAARINSELGAAPPQA